MNLFSLFASIIFVILFVLFYIKKHIYKLKNYNYHIGSSFKNNETVYYITFMPKHGVYTRTKKLKSSYSLFVSDEIIDLLVSTHITPEAAEKALESLIDKLKNLK